MKIAAVLVVLSVYYIASTEQAAAISGVHRYSSNAQSSKEQDAGYPGVYEHVPDTQSSMGQDVGYPGVYEYPSKQLKEIQYRLQQAMGDFETSAKALAHHQRAKAQYDVPTDPQKLYECAHQDCGKCVPCPKTTCVKTVWGACVLRKPYIDNCCTRVPDPACLGLRAACKKALDALSG